MNAADPLAAEVFHRLVERWHDFYLLAGTAAATLMGLLFVSLSIHIERVVAEAGAHLEAMAREAFASFIMVLAISLVFLTPGMARRPLGTALVGLGIVRGVMTAIRLRRTLGGARNQRARDRRVSFLRFAFPIVASGFMLWAGVAFLRRESDDALAEIMTACVLLLADATRTAYELLVRTARASRPGNAHRG